MFESDVKYEAFRATFKVWISSLYTLDGTDFKNDFEAIVSHFLITWFLSESQIQGNWGFKGKAPIIVQGEGTPILDPRRIKVARRGMVRSEAKGRSWWGFAAWSQEDEGNVSIQSESIQKVPLHKVTCWENIEESLRGE
jgi:hypothetical protein